MHSVYHHKRTCRNGLLWELAKNWKAKLYKLPRALRLRVTWPTKLHSRLHMRFYIACLFSARANLIALYEKLHCVKRPLLRYVEHWKIMSYIGYLPIILKKQKYIFAFYFKIISHHKLIYFIGSFVKSFNMCFFLVYLGNLSISCVDTVI